MLRGLKRRMKVLLFGFKGMSFECSVGGSLGKSRCLVRDPSELSVMLRNLYGSPEGGGASMDDASVRERWRYRVSGEVLCDYEEGLKS